MFVHFSLVLKRSPREILIGTLVFMAAGFAESAAAETIYLKSGLSISVTRTQEKDGQILYWIGADQYSIEKDAVLKIEAGDAPISKGSFSAVSYTHLTLPTILLV